MRLLPGIEGQKSKQMHTDGRLCWWYDEWQHKEFPSGWGSLFLTNDNLLIPSGIVAK